MEEQKNKGNLSLDEYDTLRIRYERKLGNKEAVSKLQEAKGFKSSKIEESRNKKEELYDDFVDGYSSVKNEEFSEISSKQIFSKSTKRILLVLFVLLAFGIGIFAGISALHTVENETGINITVSDSAFSANDTITSINATQSNNTTLQKNTVQKYQKINTSKLLIRKILRKQLIQVVKPHLNLVHLQVILLHDLDYREYIL